MSSELRSRATKAAATNGTPPNEARDPSRDRVDKGRARSGLEIPRKLLHSSISIIVTWLWLQHPNVPFTIRVAANATFVVVSADLLRFRYPAFEELYERALGYFMRESERHMVNGVIYYLVGVLICLTFYPRDIAALSVIVLSVCDTSASVFGRLFGKYTPRLPFSGTLIGGKKSLAGTLGAVATGCIASYVFWSKYAVPGDEGDLSWVPGRLMSTWNGATSVPPTFLPRLPNPQSTLELGSLVLLCGLVAGLAEAIDVFGLDDNLSLPVLFGLFVWFFMYIIG